MVTLSGLESGSGSGSGFGLGLSGSGEGSFLGSGGGVLYSSPGDGGRSGLDSVNPKPVIGLSSKFCVSVGRSLNGLSS